MLRRPSARGSWNALKNFSLVISMITNLVLIVVVLVLITQIGAIKLTLGSVLGQLDSAFEGLGESTIVDSIAIDQQVPVKFTLPLNQDTTVVTQGPVPINVPATFSLGPFGTINGTVSLQLPTGTSLPVHLDLSVPVETQIAVKFNQPVAINLYAKGLGPVVDKLRASLGPVIQMVKQLPDGFQLTGP
jgi:hypothetical protein